MKKRQTKGRPQESRSKSPGIVLIALLGLLLVALACGGDDARTPTAVPPASSVTPTSTPPPVAPRATPTPAQTLIPSVSPTVSIESPSNLEFFGSPGIEVSGTVADPFATVLVNQVTAMVSAGRFTARIELEEGNHTITVVARNRLGELDSASIQVTLDTTPPSVVFASPPDGFVTNEPFVTATGMINDTVVGTVNGDQAQVSINGIAAEVANRSFLAADIPLSPGPNTITAKGVDRAGNTTVSTITVIFEEVADKSIIRLISGNNQTGAIGGRLEEPLVVEVIDEDGNPAVGEIVIFKVIENNGTLSASPEEVRSIAVETDSAGHAQVHWDLGSRSGAGNNVVDAIAVGFQGMAIFTATAKAALPDKINVDAGDNQTGIVSSSLSKPFVAVVTDQGHNRLSKVPITFTVIEGGGNFDGRPSITLDSDSDGRALAVLTLGHGQDGDVNVVEATYPDNPGLPARFVSYGKVPADPLMTRVTGVVLDNSGEPVSGVTMQIKGTDLSVRTNNQGQFEIRPAPVGSVVLVVDGATAQREGFWPRLEFDMVTVAGQDNTTGMPIHLLPLDIDSGLEVDANTGGTLTLNAVPGFSLTIEPGSATFPNGSRSGTVTVTVVNNEKIPMVPNFGQQPRFIVTIQPAGVIFDPPAPITLPNVDLMTPGEVTEMYSFDHDLGQFISIGTGTVSEDGMIISSDPGVGIIKGGWHCGGNPAESGRSAVLKLSVSPEEVILRLDEEFNITAKGTPPRDAIYSWRIVDGDPDVVEFIRQRDCRNLQTCVAALKAKKGGEVTVRVTFTCTTTGQSLTADVIVKVVAMDLDIDSDNDNGLDPPLRSDGEDDIEDDADKPGKKLLINDDGDDNDGIPDFADGFDFDGRSGNSDDVNPNEEFVELVLELTGPIDIEEATVKINYSASKPSDMQVRGTAPDLIYTPGPGHLRIWTKDGNQRRDKASIADDGDFVAPGQYEAAKLGFTDAKRTITLYLEGIAVTEMEMEAVRRITVEVDPDGGGPEEALEDAVVVSVYAQNVVFIIIDGQKPDILNSFITGPGAGGALATIMEGNISIPDTSTVFPSYTFAAQASLVTGVHPGTHGITGNEFMDRSTLTFRVFDAEAAKTPDDVIGAYGYVSTIAGALGGALNPFGTLCEGGIAQAGPPTDRGLANLDLLAQTIYQFTPAELRTLVTHHMYWTGADTYQPPLPIDLCNYNKNELASTMAYDTAMMDKVVGYINENPVPHLMTLYFAGVDHESHLRGVVNTTQMNYLKSTVDPQMQRLVNALEEKDLLDHTTFVLSADHGHQNVTDDDSHAIEIETALDSELEEVIQDAGGWDVFDFAGLDVFRETSFSAFVGLNGGMASIYLKNRSTGNWRNLPRLDEDVWPVVESIQDHRVSTFFDLNTELREGGTDGIDDVLVRVGGGYQVYRETQAQASCGAWHDGFLCPLTVLRSTYVRAQERVAAHENQNRSGDIILLSNFLGGYYFSGPAKATHGSLYPSDSMIPFMIGGEPVRDGRITVGNSPCTHGGSAIDVAPTIATILGFDMAGSQGCARVKSELP